MKRMFKAVLSLALAILMMSPSQALAQEGTEEALTAGEQTEAQMSILEEEKLKSSVEELLASYGITGKQLQKVSFAYTYTGTGDRWYYNADTWMYGASMYKVPMMMILAEREAKGELTQESDLGGCTLAKAEELVLVHSNNDYAHVVRKYLGGDDTARKLYQSYSPLEESYYDSDFMDYCYFTARYMNDVMETLYREPERFPQIIELLKTAMPQNFYHLKIDPSYQIAQKYGSFQEQSGTFFNNNTGIVYTQNPFILTVMTENLSYEKAEKLMGDAAKLFLDYTLELDTRLESFKQEQEAARIAAEEAEQAAKEAERKAAEEAARKEQEAKEAAAAAERERIAQAQKEQEEAAAKAKREKLGKIAAGVGAAVAIIGSAAAVIGRQIKKKRRIQEEARRIAEIRRRRYGLEEPEEPQPRFEAVRKGLKKLQRDGNRVGTADVRRNNGRSDYRPKH